jgi:hypothetical protein
MNPWIILAIGLVAVLFVVLPVAGATLARYRRPQPLRCPLAGTDATVKVDAVGAALWELLGVRRLRVEACSRWPGVWGCRQQCVADEEVDSAEAEGATRAQAR